ncbi:MAG TPA: hypothetical protein VKQ09_01990 [Sphingomonas sp.]|nr:hypothetical protein [Sphingomonas sp.]
MRARWHGGGWWPGLVLAVLVADPGRAEAQPPIVIHYVADLIGDAAGGRAWAILNTRVACFLTASAAMARC